MKRLLLIHFAILFAFCCRAQSELPLNVDSCNDIGCDSSTILRPVTSAYMLEIGAASIADSYLSPITYNGWTTAFAYERMQAMKFDPQNWVMQLIARFSIDRTRNIADNATSWRFDGSLSWGMLHRWKILPGLTLAAGASTGIDAGCIYNQRNSNNPASAKFAWTVNATAYLAYNTKIGKIPVTLRYQPEIPLAGIFFSPDYDELYYEIYLGNHSNLSHFAWPGNRFVVSNNISADIHFGATSLRIGYRHYSLSSEANKIVTNIHSHSFIVGISGEWLSLSPRNQLSRDARIISALF